MVVTPSEEMKETAEGATAAAKTEEQKPEEQVCVCVCVTHPMSNLFPKHLTNWRGTPGIHCSHMCSSPGVSEELGTY